jgi:hypothetical protein
MNVTVPFAGGTCGRGRGFGRVVVVVASAVVTRGVVTIVDDDGGVARFAPALVHAAAMHKSSETTTMRSDGLRTPQP